MKESQRKLVSELLLKDEFFQHSLCETTMTSSGTEVYTKVVWLHGDAPNKYPKTLK